MYGQPNFDRSVCIGGSESGVSQSVRRFDRFGTETHTGICSSPHAHAFISILNYRCAYILPVCTRLSSQRLRLQ